MKNEIMKSQRNQLYPPSKPQKHMKRHSLREREHKPKIKETPEQMILPSFEVGNEKESEDMRRVFEKQREKERGVVRRNRTTHSHIKRASGSLSLQKAGLYH